MPAWLLVACVFPSCHQLDAELQSVVGLLEATLIERPAQITRELPSVLHVLLPLLQSPLAAPRIQQVFLDIGVCLMPKHLHSLGRWSVMLLQCVDKALSQRLKSVSPCFFPSSCACGSCDIANAEARVWSGSGLGTGGPGHSSTAYCNAAAQPHCPTEREQSWWWAQSQSLRS